MIVRPLKISNRNKIMSVELLKKGTPSKIFITNEVVRPKPPSDKSSDINSDCSSQSVGVWDQDRRKLELNHHDAMRAISQHNIPSISYHIAPHQGIQGASNQDLAVNEVSPNLS
jgi:hypothetical protein